MRSRAARLYRRPTLPTPSRTVQLCRATSRGATPPPRQTSNNAMRYNLKIIIPAIVLAAMLLSMAPIGAPVAHAAEPPNDKISSDFGCDLPGVGFSKCVAAVVYWIGPGIASIVASIGAYFFSIVVQLSLNSTAYALDFLSTGWTTVRDIANMAFIFILIY